MISRPRAIRQAVLLLSPPPPNVQVAIQGIAALLRGAERDFAEVALDMTGIPALNQRVYAYARAIPRGETRTYAEIASALRASGAVYSVAQAIARNPFMIIVPCHRVLEAGNYAEDLAAWRGDLQAPAAVDRGHQPTASKTLFDVPLPVAPPRAHN